MALQVLFVVVWFAFSDIKQVFPLLSCSDKLLFSMNSGNALFHRQVSELYVYVKVKSQTVEFSVGSDEVLINNFFSCFEKTKNFIKILFTKSYTLSVLSSLVVLK